MSISGSCIAANYTSCSGYTGGCYCDLACYSARDCCPDIAQTCQPCKCSGLHCQCIQGIRILSYIVTITLSRSWACSIYAHDVNQLVCMHCESSKCQSQFEFSTANGDYVCYQNSQCTQLGLPSSASSESGCCNSARTTHFINISTPTECRPCG